MSFQLDRLAQTVQHNCHIADARHASDYTMCVYLLKMREYYRWEMGLPFTQSLSNREVGDWLVARESLWQALEGEDYRPIETAGAAYDCFDAEAINEALTSERLVYSGGLGHHCRPHFFLADLERREEHGAFQILVAGKEHARDLTAPPAMARDNTIFVRRESFQRLIWEKFEEWRWQKRDNPMGRAIAAYDFERDVDEALESMTDNEVEAVVLHEVGEVLAGDALGEPWHDMIAALPRSRTEIMARAVRDHLADALSTLPGLLERELEASLHFYVANLNGMRREIFPSLLAAYEEWHSTGHLQALHRQVDASRQHWQHVAEDMLNLYQRHGPDCGDRLESLIARSYL
jgi:hypothetical protein